MGASAETVRALAVVCQAEITDAMQEVTRALRVAVQDLECARMSIVSESDDRGEVLVELQETASTVEVVSVEIVAGFSSTGLAGQQQAAMHTDFLWMIRSMLGLITRLHGAPRCAAALRHISSILLYIGCGPQSGRKVEHIVVPPPPPPPSPHPGLLRWWQKNPKDIPAEPPLADPGWLVCSWRMLGCPSISRCGFSVLLFSFSCAACFRFACACRLKLHGCDSLLFPFAPWGVSSPPTPRECSTVFPVAKYGYVCVC